MNAWFLTGTAHLLAKQFDGISKVFNTHNEVKLTAYIYHTLVLLSFWTDLMEGQELPILLKSEHLSLAKGLDLLFPP